jgi:HK97 family phage major capsid protein
MPFDSIIDRTDAGALIPEGTISEIIQELPQQSAALRFFRNVPLSTKTTRQRVLSALPAAYFVNGDTGLKQTTEADWSNQYLVAEELAVIVPIPENVVDDADIDMWAEIKPLLIEAFGLKIDAAVIFGDDKPSTWGDALITSADAMPAMSWCVDLLLTRIWPAISRQ